jgi:hypothetical protein
MRMSNDCEVMNEQRWHKEDGLDGLRYCDSDN